MNSLYIALSSCSADVEQWRVIEIPFESQTDYDRTGADRICMDVTFSFKGDLDIYKHGFIQAEAGCKYMTYADGTPFFYLGDTHWGMYREELYTLVQTSPIVTNTQDHTTPFEEDWGHPIQKLDGSAC